MSYVNFRVKFDFRLRLPSFAVGQNCRRIGQNTEKIDERIS